MPTFYKRKIGAKPRGQWDPDRLQEAINRIQQGDISFREADRPSVTANNEDVSHEGESRELQKTPVKQDGPQKQTRLPQPEPIPSTSAGVREEPETPSKYLHEVSPIPRLIEETKSKKGKQKGALILTSEENRTLLKRKFQEKQAKEEAKKHKELKKKRLSFSKNERKKLKTSSDLNSCVECLENYYETTKNTDWLCCATCKLWVHEDCTIFDEFCVDCGRKNKQKNKN